MMTTEQKKTIDAFRYWVETNEENGVVTLPEYLCKGVLEVINQIQTDSERRCGIMERLKLRFIGKNGSMGLRKNRVYILNGKINNGYIYLDINGLAVPYTISGFVANWKAGEQE